MIRLLKLPFSVTFLIVILTVMMHNDIYSQDAQTPPPDSLSTDTSAVQTVAADTAVSTDTDAASGDSLATVSAETTDATDPADPSVPVPDAAVSETDTNTLSQPSVSGKSVAAETVTDPGPVPSMKETTDSDMTSDMETTADKDTVKQIRSDSTPKPTPPESLSKTDTIQHVQPSVSGTSSDTKAVKEPEPVSETDEASDADTTSERATTAYKDSVPQIHVDSTSKPAPSENETTKTDTASSIVPEKASSTKTETPETLPVAATEDTDSSSTSGSEKIREMPLDDVLRQTITYNPQILSARADWLGKCRQHPATWAIFEPEAVAGYKGGASEQRGSRFPEEKYDVNAGVEGKLITGAEYNIGFSTNEIMHSSYMTGVPRAFSGISISQPLLKGAWFGAPTTEITIAKIDMNIAFHRYRSELMSTLYNVESAYWNLSFAQEKVGYAHESVDIATKLLTDSKGRYSAGKMSKLGLLEAEAELAYRIALRTDAQRELQEAANQLKITISNSRIDSRIVIRTTSPLFLMENEFDSTLLDRTISEASIEYQPDYLISQYTSSRGKKVVNYQANQCLPSVNLTGSYGYYAYGRNGNTAYGNFIRHNLLTWSAGVEARVPLLFGAKARSDLIAARLKSQTAFENIEAKEYELKNSLILIRDRLRALRERIVNARTVVKARERQLDVEFGAIAAGKSNFRRAFEIEEALDKAKQWELESHVLYRQSCLQWALLCGTLLQQKGFETIENEQPVLIEHLSGPYKYLLWFLLTDKEMN